MATKQTGRFHDAASSINYPTRDARLDPEWVDRMLMLTYFKGAGAEVGVFKGSFTSMILKYTKPSKLFLVDPWLFQRGPRGNGSGTWYGGKIAKSQADMDAIYAHVESTFGGKPNVRVLRMRSNAFWASQPRDSLDFVYSTGRTVETRTLEGAIIP